MLLSCVEFNSFTVFDALSVDVLLLVNDVFNDEIKAVSSYVIHLSFVSSLLGEL